MPGVMAPFVPEDALADAANADDFGGTASPGQGAGGLGPDSDPMPVTVAEVRSAVLLGFIFVVNIALAVLFAQPFLDAGLQAFEDPDDVGNSVWYLLLILAFTFLILWIAKRGQKWLIQGIILTAVGSTVAYVIGPLLMIFGIPALTSWLAAILVGAASVFALWKHPEWYVIDVVGVLVAAGAAAIFGISLSLVPVVVLLVALAIYDAIAVYKTRHMLALADSVMELRLPVLLVIPKVRHYHFREEAARFKEAGPETKGEREAMFMGLGDLVMPTILVVSALQFAQPAWGGIPAIGAAVGTLVGYSVLITYVLRGNPQAGLPLLNGGAIVGFLTGVWWTTGSLVFW